MKKKTSKKAFKCNHEDLKNGEICDDCFEMILSDINDEIWGVTKKLLDKYDNANVSAQMIMNTLLREGAFVGSLMDMSIGDFVHESADVFGETMMALNDDEEPINDEPPNSPKEPVEENTVELAPKQTPDKSLN